MIDIFFQSEGGSWNVLLGHIPLFKKRHVPYSYIKKIKNKSVIVFFISIVKMKGEHRVENIMVKCGLSRCFLLGDIAYLKKCSL